MNKWIKIKLNGGAMYFVIIATVISSMLILAFITFQFNVAKEIHLYLMSDQVRDKINQQNFSLDSTLVITNEKWGYFTLRNTIGSTNNNSYQELALMAYRLDLNHQTLIVPESRHPIYITGNTKLKGDCLLPVAGIKRAYIEGKNYHGIQLIYGNKLKAPESFPILNNGILEILQEVLSVKMEEVDGIVSEDSIQNLSQSFREPTAYIYLQKATTLSNATIKGKVVIHSSFPLEIGSSTSLENVIIIAPEVVFKSGFKGSAQVFASKSIQLEDKVFLNYPSFLTVFNEEQSNVQLEIGKHAKVSGGALVCTMKYDQFKPPILSIQDKAILEGEVYSNGYLQNKGMIHGRTYAKKLYLKTRSSSYENHLLDATFDVTALPEGFLGIHWVEENNELEPLIYERDIQ